MLKYRIIETANNVFIPQIKDTFLGFGFWHYFQPKADVNFSTRKCFTITDNAFDKAQFNNKQDAEDFITRFKNKVNTATQLYLEAQRGCYVTEEVKKVHKQ